jgi:hypothetical protein
MNPCRRLLWLLAAIAIMSGARAQPPAAATITIQATPATVAPGATVTLTTSVSGATPLAYTWLRNDSILSGATGPTLTLTNVQTSDAGFYNVLVRISPVASSYGLGASVQVISPSGPQPGDRLWLSPETGTANAGSDWIFTLFGDSGVGEFSVQWYKNGVLIPGASGRQLQLHNVQASDLGDYYAVASGFTSSVAHLAFATILPPAFAEQPHSTWAEIGGSASFGVSFVPTGFLTLQWFKDGVPIPGATLPSINISPVSASSYGSYTLVATNSAGSVTSDPGILAPRTPPTITAQPQSQVIPLGGSGTLSVTATGPASVLPITYQWRKNGADIPGATAATFVLSNAQPADAGSYSVTVSGLLGYTSSATAAVTVGFTAPVPGFPGIQLQPADTTATVGETVSFSVGVSGASPLVYQWKKDGVAIANSGSGTLTLSNVQAGDAGSYTVTITNSAGSITSNPAALVVSGAVTGSGPVIAHQPESVVTAIGSTVEFSVTATGPGPLSYTWRKDGRLLTGITGSPTLTLNNVQTGDEGSYEVIISSPLGTVTSATVTLHFGAAPTITSQPTGVRAVVGNSVVLAVDAQGQPAPGYQWQKDGVALAGKNEATLLLDNVQLAAGGSYTVVVTNSYGSATSAPATVSVVAPVPNAGIYFGTFGPGGKDGQFGLQVKSDGSAVLIGYLAGRSNGFAVSFPVNPDGGFSVPLPLARLVGQDSSGRGNGATAKSDATSTTLHGTIGGGTVVGQTDDGTLPFSGDRTSTSGAAAGLAGCYMAPMLNTATSTLYSMVGADGRVLVVATGDSPTAGQGQVGLDGTFDILAGNGAHIGGTIDPNAKTLNGGMSGSGSPVEFAGLSTESVSIDRLANISTRGRTGLGDDVMIAGFILSGTAPRQILIRAVGPTLGSLGVNGALPQSHLELYRGSTRIAEGDDWGQQPNAALIAAAASRIGAFDLSGSSHDAALLVTLDPGVYTAQVRGATGATGVALVEVYDAGTALPGSDVPKLANISTRGRVGTGDEILIAGIIVGGNTPKRLLVRAIGPTLESFGVTGVLADPELTIFDGNKPINSNDDWAGNAEIASVADSIGAFPLPAGSKDAVLMITLAPGVYTAQVRGKGNTTGNALVEVYEIPDQIGAP